MSIAVTCPTGICPAHRSAGRDRRGGAARAARRRSVRLRLLTGPAATGPMWVPARVDEARATATSPPWMPGSKAHRTGRKAPAGAPSAAVRTC